MQIDLSKVHDPAAVTDEELIGACATLMAALRTRGITRTRNIVGDLGERYAVSAYARHLGRSITIAATNSKNVDAVDAAGIRFAIKTASPDSTRTSCFHFEREHPESDQIFEHLVVVRIDDHLRPSMILEFTWAQFYEFKQWNARQHAWFLPLNRMVVAAARVVFRAPNPEEVVVVR